jgi:undecaprenyl diphosphate synthase
MVKELRIEIFGRVQGVGFRHFVRESAERLGLKGFVRNRKDGSVLIVAQGEEGRLKELLKLTQAGPQFAKVDGVSYFWRKPENKYDRFVIALDKGMIDDQKSSFFNLGRRIFGVKSKVPRHIALIPDGNRRWAMRNGYGDVSRGHKTSATKENFISLFDKAQELGIEYMTFWGFSTENWKRSSKEVKILFDLLFKFMKDFGDEFVKRKIRFRHLGRKDRLPKILVDKIKILEEKTKKFDDFHFQLCWDYGGRDEISRAVNKILKAGVQEVNEDDLKHYLDSADIPDPDLIIRTSGEKRMSGFMSFQSAYSEFYFVEKDFPNFGPEDLEKAVRDFASRGRRAGK